MNKSEELSIVSESLILFLSKEKDIKSLSVIELYNKWADKSGIQIQYPETLKWTYSFLQQRKNDPIFKNPILKQLLTKEFLEKGAN